MSLLASRQCQTCSLSSAYSEVNIEHAWFSCIFFIIIIGRVAVVRGVAAFSRQTFAWTICRSVGRCVGLSSALWKNGGSDPDAV